MTKFRSKLVTAVVVLCAATLHAQSAATPSTGSTDAADSKTEPADCLSGAVKDIKRALAAGRSPMTVLTRWPVYICQFTTDPIRAKLLTKAEQKRQDKQPGTTSGSSGSTSLVSKGSSPWLLGFALEHGGLTQSTNGNTITFRGNVANSIRALLDGTYVGSYDLGAKDPLVQALAKVSFGVSFDAGSNAMSTGQGFVPGGNNFSGFSTKYEIYNHRDPRDQRYRADWNHLAFDEGTAIASSLMNLDKTITDAGAPFEAWEKSQEAAVAKLSTSSTDAEILEVVTNAANSFHDAFWDLPAIQSAVAGMTRKMSAFLQREDQIIANARKTALVTVEYNYTRQLTTSDQTVSATQPNQKLPALSNINLVLEKGFQGVNAPELTFNAGVTFFNTSSSGTAKWGTVRDYTASTELDVPLKEIQNIGQPTLSFAGQFLSLLEEPLGQQVMLNGVTVSRKGNMGVFQTKLSIPVKDSGVKIPISFTYASRTELIKEKDVRGNIGITFDLDTLFSKAAAN